MTVFIRRGVKRNVQDGFRILLPAADAVQMFGMNLKLSRIAAVPQAHLQPRLIFNLLENLNDDTTSVNVTSDR